jgi:hypothetical protein
MAIAPKRAVMDFIGYAVEKGLVNTNTGGGWRSAASKILEDFGDDDDLAGIDVPSEVLRYNNRHPGVLSPDSLNQYQKRVITILAEFTKYQNNPTTYKGVLRGPIVSKGDSAKKDGKRPPLKQLSAPDTSAVAQTEAPQHRLSAVTESSLMMPFPLRPNFLVQIIVPRDMTKDEASRLCTFISALGQDPQMVSQ